MSLTRQRHFDVDRRKFNSSSFLWRARSFNFVLKKLSTVRHQNNYNILFCLKVWLFECEALKWVNCHMLLLIQLRHSINWTLEMLSITKKNSVFDSVVHKPYLWQKSLQKVYILTASVILYLSFLSCLEMLFDKRRNLFTLLHKNATI